MREGGHGAGIAEAGQHASPGHSLERRVMRSSQGLPWQLGLRERGPNHSLGGAAVAVPGEAPSDPEGFPTPHTQIKGRRRTGDALPAGRVSLDTGPRFGESGVQPVLQEPREPGPQLLQDELTVPSYTPRGTVLGSHSQAQGGHEFGGTSQVSES